MLKNQKKRKWKKGRGRKIKKKEITNPLTSDG